MIRASNVPDAVSALERLLVTRRAARHFVYIHSEEAWQTFGYTVSKKTDAADPKRNQQVG
jgi:hypothetical protein